MDVRRASSSEFTEAVSSTDGGSITEASESVFLVLGVGVLSAGTEGVSEVEEESGLTSIGFRSAAFRTIWGRDRSERVVGTPGPGLGAVSRTGWVCAGSAEAACTLCPPIVASSAGTCQLHQATATANNRRTATPPTYQRRLLLGSDSPSRISSVASGGVG